MGVYAWSFGCSASEVTALLSRWDGKLGAVLYPQAYGAALKPGRFIAFCGGSDDARTVAGLVDKGAKFDAAVYLDEQNGRMPTSGYLKQAANMKTVLDSVSVPFWGMTTRGLSNGRADLAFLRGEVSALRLPRVCWNSSGSRDGILLDAGSIKMPWLLSPHPYRLTFWPPFNSGWLNWILDHLHGRTARWYVELAKKRADIDVAFWCLRAYGPGQFGLHRKDGSLSSLGKAVRAILVGR